MNWRMSPELWRRTVCDRSIRNWRVRTHEEDSGVCFDVAARLHAFGQTIGVFSGTRPRSAYTLSGMALAAVHQHEQRLRPNCANARYLQYSALFLHTWRGTVCQIPYWSPVLCRDPPSKEWGLRQAVGYCGLGLNQEILVQATAVDRCMPQLPRAAFSKAAL